MYHRKIDLLGCPSVRISEQTGQIPCTRLGLGCGNDPAGIPVQPVTYGGLEGIQAFGCNGAALQKIGDNTFVY